MRISGLEVRGGGRMPPPNVVLVDVNRVDVNRVDVNIVDKV